MKDTTAEHAYQLYARHGVGSETLLLPTEFGDFWAALDESDRDYWIEQLRHGPTGLSKKL
jgi:hypothetical protein